MLYAIVSLLLELLTGLVGGACLLRVYMQHQRIAMSAHAGNPLGGFVFALSDWLVLPLRRVVPALGRWDLASLLAAFGLELVQFVLLWLLMGATQSVVSLPILAAFSLVRMAISGLTGLVIVYAVLSWLQTSSPLADVMGRLCAPVLSPLRRVLPLVGGVDLSPLVLLVLLQIATMVLGQLQDMAMRLS